MTTDVLDEAMMPPVTLDRTYFGQVVIVDAYACVLRKGIGKLVFDPTQHGPDEKRIAIKIGIECQSLTNGGYTVDQDTINTGKEWREVTLPSLNKIARDLRSLQGAFVQFKRTPTGERYQAKASGEWKDKTALQFMAVYADADSMQAAADVFYTPRNGDTAPGPVAAAPAPPAAPAAPAATSTIDRATAASFLPVIWSAAGQDKNKFWDLVRKNAMLLPHFGDIRCAEMVQYLGDDFLPF